MREGRREGSDLPAEYVDPWRLLGQDLRAVLASLRLRLWEMWRRNRSGELWRPAVWPATLAPLFWPVALALLLIALAVGLTGLGAFRAAPGPAAAPAVSGRASSPLDALPVAQSSSPENSSPESASPVIPSPEIPPTVMPSPVLPPPESGEGPPVQMPAPASGKEAPPPADPLRSALGETGEGSLLEVARAEPGRGLLVLTAAPAYGALPAAERRERARGWWRQGQELGYEQLEVRDGRGRLLVRSALVGGGLVLFEPAAAVADGDPA